MAFEKVPHLGEGGTGFQGTGLGTAAAMLTELQGLTRSVVSGAGAATNIAVTGIATEDTIVSVWELVSGVPTTDRTSVATITSAGNIQLSAVTTGNKLDIFWYNKR